MQLIKPMTWEEVFQIWTENEANNPGWVHCATKIKGWPDWESWRRYSAGLLKLDTREWGLYSFSDPMTEVPEMLVGPFMGWQKNLPEKNVLCFKDFLEVPEKYEQFHDHEGVIRIMNAMPFSSTLTGLVRADNLEVLCVEGHHRAAALALAKKLGRVIKFRDEKITLAMAALPKEELYLLDKALEIGTQKPK